MQAGLQDWTHNLSLLEIVEKKPSSKELEWQRLSEKKSVNSIGKKNPTTHPQKELMCWLKMHHNYRYRNELPLTGLILPATGMRENLPAVRVFAGPKARRYSSFSVIVLF